MTKRLGIFPLCAALGVLLALSGAKEVQAGFAITVTVTDLTTMNPADGGTQTITDGGPLDTTPLDPTIITSGSSQPGFATTGNVSFSNLFAQFTSSTSPATSSLNLQGTANVMGGTDTYSVVVTVTNTGFTIPPAGSAALMTQSHSATYTYSTGAAGDGQTFQTWYDPNNVGGSTPFSPGPNTIKEPNSPSGTTSPPASPPNQLFAILGTDYKVPYALTDTFTIIIKGNGSSTAPAHDNFQGSVTISATPVPEPASLVMLVTGMPLPLVVLGLLRRRRAAA